MVKPELKKTLITSILALTFTGGGLHAQSEPVLPRLIVTLTVDQLRTDYLEAFASLYGERGWRRLMREARFYTQAEFPFDNPDRASAIATLMSGTTPSHHGIISENWLDAVTLRPVNCVDDTEYMGNYTHESSAPTRLLTSTFADELKIATRNRAQVYAIAPFRDAAILQAGHAATGAFWLNDRTGKWCSTTYYEDFPRWLGQYNERQSVDFRIGNLVWTPTHAPARYRFLPEWREEAFKHKPDNDRHNKYKRLTTCPLANDEVNRLTEELLRQSLLGADSIPDLLSLTYYAGNYNHLPTSECAMEVQDTYVKLDQSLAHLLDLLDRRIGLRHILFCLTGTGYADAEAPDGAIYRIPGGEFYMNRCTTLLNMYLMATYGEGQYVDAFYGNDIYLNHKLIENKRLLLSDIQEKSADFLAQFSGVAQVHSAHRLLLGAWSPQQERARAAYHPHRSGDLQITVLPGWTVMKENTTDQRATRTAYFPSPLFIMAPGISPQVIRTPINVLHLAPTLSGSIHIRAPNASHKAALRLD